MDLHSNNVVIGVMDMDGKRLASRKLPCELKEVVKFLSPFKRRLERVAVESTYDWYWLVDGRHALKYPVVLANPAGMEQYSGIKHADDTNDAFFIAELLRLAILPTGHIYDVELRPVRDLLCRRLMLVHQRTALMKRQTRPASLCAAPNLCRSVSRFQGRCRVRRSVLRRRKSWVSLRRRMAVSLARRPGSWPAHKLRCRG